MQCYPWDFASNIHMISISEQIHIHPQISTAEIKSEVKAHKQGHSEVGCSYSEWGPGKLGFAQRQTHNKDPCDWIFAWAFLRYRKGQFENKMLISCEIQRFFKKQNGNICFSAPVLGFTCSLSRGVDLLGSISRIHITSIWEGSRYPFSLRDLSRPWFVEPVHLCRLPAFEY